MQRLLDFLDRLLRWLESGNREPSPEPSGHTTVQGSETDAARICPECGHILIKYGVGLGESFLLDHCGSCNGVWLDCNEWQSLKSDKLYDKIHLIFTEPWQNDIRRESARRHFDSLYELRFGAADYRELKRIREWIHSHPKRDAVLGFLDDPDPYST